MIKIFVLVFLFLNLSVYALDITAAGFGTTQQEARANAVSELSYVIVSNVSSRLSYSADTGLGNASERILKQTDITSELPIMGAEFSITKLSDGYLAEAGLSSDASGAYEAKLKETYKAVGSALSKLKKENIKNSGYETASALASLVDNYEKLSVVYAVIAEKSAEPLPLTKTEASAWLREFSDDFDNMRLCAKIISDEAKADKVYVYYPRFGGSDEVTEFSSVFHRFLSEKYNSTGELSKAEHFLNTDYSVTGKGIYLTSVLTDKSGKTLATVSKHLLPSAYIGLDTRPESEDFEKMLKDGVQVSSDFTARISGKNGKKAVLYKGGDTAELFVKVSRPSYFYIVGHVVKSDEKFSYLVDIFNTGGDRRFIRYVDAEDANRWISIGKFRIVPPFGTEMFQLIASLDDPAGSLPPHKYSSSDNLYKISEDPYRGLAVVRALKKLESNKNEQAEDVLIFSSTSK